MKNEFDVSAATVLLLEEHRFVAFNDTRELLIWKGGAFHENAENEVRAKIEAAYPETTNHEKNEVVEKLIDRVMIERSKSLLESWPFRSLANGVVDVRPGGTFYPDFDEFSRSHPQVILTNPQPHVAYDPAARCPRFWKFLTRGFPEPDDRTLLWDHTSSLIDLRSIKRKALFLWGEPDTSKSTFLGIEERFLGDENVKNVPLDILCGDKDRFALASMRGAMLNCFADLDPKITIGYLGNFKALTGGDRMTVRAIYSKPFEMRPFVKLHFSANTPPPLKDVMDEAWWGRWDIVHARVKLDKPNKDLAQEIADTELSGIFNEVLKRFRRQFERGSFTIDKPAVEVRDTWLGQAEPAIDFVSSAFFKDPNGRVDTREVFPLWEKWRKSRKPIPGQVSHQQLNRLLRDRHSLPDRPTKSNGREFWPGIGFKGQNGQSALPGGTKVREFDNNPSTDRERRKRNRPETLSLSSLFGEVPP